MSDREREQRLRERLKLPLPVMLRCREGAGADWSEQTRLRDLTPFGAGFSLTRPVEPGRLVHLTLPMPRQLRCFDHAEEQYRLYALVRWIRFLKEREGGKLFDVGVAFTGKQPPASYLDDPTTRYEAAALPGAEEFWRAREQRFAVAAGRPVRRESRLTMPVEVIVELLDGREGVAASEQTVTENISRRGASVFTTLVAERGRFVRLRSARYSLAVLAVVRAWRRGADNISRLHMEFVDREWPLDIVE